MNVPGILIFLDMIQNMQEQQSLVQAYQHEGTTYFVKPTMPIAVSQVVPPPPQQQMCAWAAPQMTFAPGQMFYVTPVETTDPSMCQCVQPVPMVSTSPDYSDSSYAESFYPSSYATSTYASSSHAAESDMSSRASTPISVSTQASCFQPESISTRCVSFTVLAL